MNTTFSQRVIAAYRRRFRKPKSRVRKYVDRTLSVLVGIWVMLLFFPQPLYAYAAKVGRFAVYSDQPIPESIEAVIAKADSRWTSVCLEWASSRRHDRKLIMSCPPVVQPACDVCFPVI